MLSIELLGHCKVTYRRRALTLANAPRLQSLLAYLLFHRHQPIRRVQLSSLWWPDSSDARAAGNLRRLLHRLRKWLPASEFFLQVTPHHLQWTNEHPYVLDVDSFSEQLQRGELDGLEVAVGLYHGDLLPDCQDDWLSAHRARLREAYTQAQTQRLEAWKALGQWHKAISIAEELLQHEPYLDEVFRGLIQLHWHVGDRQAARLAYQRYSQILQEELGLVSVPPLSELLEHSLLHHTRREEPSVVSAPLAPLSLRFSQLTPQAQGLLWLMSIAGQQVPLELFHRAAAQLSTLAVLPREPSEATEALRSLVQQLKLNPSPRTALFAWLCEGLNGQFLVEYEPGIFGFVEESTQEWLVHRMSGAEQSALHLVVVEAWEQLANEGELIEPALLAWHWERAGDRQRAAQWYHKAAQAAVKRQHLQEAYSFYKAQLRLQPENTLEAVRSRLALGRDVLLVLGRYDEAHEELALCLTFAEALGEFQLLAKVSFAMGSLLHRKGDLPGAEALQRDAIQIFREAESRHDEVHALCEMAAMSSEQSDYTYALSLYQEAASLALAHELPELRGRALGGMATIAFVTGQYIQAMELYEKALQVYGQNSSLANESRTLNNLCVLYMEQGLLEQAEHFGRRSLHLRRQRGDQAGQGTALNNLAAIQWHRGNHHEALRLYREALSLWQNLDYPRGKGHTLNNIGGIESDLGEVSQALQTLSEALRCAKESNDRRLVAYNYLFTAICHRRAGSYTQAAETLDEAERCFITIEASSELVRCLCERGFLALALQQEAGPFLQSAQEQYPCTLPHTSQLGRLLLQLQEAIEARQKGSHLVHGAVAAIM